MSSWLFSTLAVLVAVGLVSLLVFHTMVGNLRSHRSTTSLETALHAERWEAWNAKTHSKKTPPAAPTFRTARADLDAPVAAAVSGRTQAVVFRARTISEGDGCRFRRFQALFEVVTSLGWDCYLLHNPNMRISRRVRAAVADNPHVYIESAPEKPSRWVRNLQVSGPFGQHLNSWQFQLWLKKKAQYKHAWLVEDDVVFTGNWSAFFRTASLSGGSADLVAAFNDNMNWPWSWSHMHSAGQRLVRAGRRDASRNATFSVGAKLTLFRLSTSLASFMVDQVDAGFLNGYDEALLPLACDHMPLGKNCSRSALYVPEGSVFEAGHGGVSEAILGTDVYSLKCLAAYSNGTCNRSLYPTDADVPANRLYHPAKCIDTASLNHIGYEPQQRWGGHAGGGVGHKEWTGPDGFRYTKERGGKMVRVDEVKTSVGGYPVLSGGSTRESRRHDRDRRQERLTQRVGQNASDS